MCYCGDPNTDREVLEHHITTYLDKLVDDVGIPINEVSTAMMNRDVCRNIYVKSALEILQMKIMRTYIIYMKLVSK